MLRETPYIHQVEDLTLEMEHFRWDMHNYDPHNSVFSVDTLTLPHFFNKYIDREFQKKASVILTIPMYGTFPETPVIFFTAFFNVSRPERLEAGYMNVRVLEYCFDLIKEYLDTEPLTDKNGNHFPMPKRFYNSETFKDVPFY